METLARGTALDADDVRATGASAGAPIVIERGLGECPHGFWYEARQEEVALLLTVVDPVLVAQGDVRARLQREVERTQRISHRNLLRCFGMGSANSRVFIAEAWPAGGTVREFARQRVKHEQPIDGPTAYTLIAHICNAAASLHERHMVHGYITPDTVHVSKEGRVLLAGRGIGPSLPRARGFARFRAGGLLPGIAPEQLGTSARLAATTDVFAIAALFTELLTGKGPREAGQSVSELGVSEPRGLVELLNSALAREPERRPHDASAFKAALAEALQSVGLRADTRPPPSDQDAEPADEGHPPPQMHEPAQSWVQPGYPTHDPQVPPPPEGYAEAYPGYYAPLEGAPGWAGAPAPGWPAQPGWPPHAVPPGYPVPPGYAAPPPPGWPGQHQQGMPPPPGHYPMPQAPAGYPGAGYPAPYPAAPAPPAAPGPGWPAAPAAAQAPAAAPATQDAMAELERATRHLAGSDKAGALALTTNLDDQSDDEEEDDDDDDDGPPASNSSMLGLRLGEYEDAADRLATVDGKASTAESAGPSRSGTFFGNFADSDSATDLVRPDDDATYYVVRDERDYGPYGLDKLRAMIGEGKIRSVDVLRDATTQGKSLVVDIVPLREACRALVKEQDGPLELAAPVRGNVAGPGANPMERRDGRRSGGSSRTLVLVLVALAAFGAVGWWLWSTGALLR